MALKTLPKFYNVYCDTDTINSIDKISDDLKVSLDKEGLTNDDLVKIRDDLKAGIANLNIVFSHDIENKVPRVYIVTQDKDGEPYGFSGTAHKLLLRRV